VTDGRIGEILNEGVPIYYAGPSDGASDDLGVLGSDRTGLGGDLESVLAPPNADAKALPAASLVLDSLGADAALVGPDGRVQVAGTVGEVRAAVLVEHASVTRLRGGAVPPALVVALPNTVVEILPLADGVLVHTRGEVARVDVTGSPRWQVPGVYKSIVLDDQRVWLESAVDPAVAVSLANGERVAVGARGRAVPSTSGGPVRYRRDSPYNDLRLYDADGNALLAPWISGTPEVVGEQLRFEVGPWVAAVGFDGRFLRFEPVAHARPKLVQDGKRLVDGRGRVVVERTVDRSLRRIAGRDRWIVEVASGGPWLVLDHTDVIGILDADRVIEAAGALWGSTPEGLAKWELP